MITSLRPKLTTMKTSLRVPSISGREWKPGAQITVNPGTWAASSAGSAMGRNMYREKRLRPRELGDDPDRQLVFLVGADVAVEDI